MTRSFDGTTFLLTTAAAANIAIAIVSGTWYNWLIGGLLLGVLGQRSVSR